MSKVNELLAKLKALAEQGVGGEKENAAAKLEQLMAKHGITPDQLESEEVKQQYITQENRYDSRVITQCVVKVMGPTQVYSADHKDGRKVVMWESTDVQYLEIKALTEFYRALWAEEVDFFFFTFVQKHRLLPPNAPVGEATNSKDIEKMRNMAKAMEDRQYHKQLKSH